MTTNNDSQCYFVQLQIDSFLDGELVAAQQEVFMGHVSSCTACAKELHFARSLHDAVMDLPMIDCSDAALEPVHRISQGKPVEEFVTKPPRVGMWEAFGDWLAAIPLGVRVAVPAFALVIAVVLPGGGVKSPETSAPNPQVAAENTAVDYSAEDIQQALMDLNMAIEYLNDVSERTEVMIGERFVVTPLQESLNASFDRSRLNRRSEGGRVIQNDPI